MPTASAILHGVRRYFIAMGSLALLACSQAAPVPHARDTSNAHAWDVTRDETTIHVTNRPGLIVDTTAPPLPPGVEPLRHPFLSATCSGSASACSEAGHLLQQSHSIAEFLAALRDVDFDVQESHAP